MKNFVQFFLVKGKTILSLIIVSVLLTSCVGDDNNTKVTDSNKSANENYPITIKTYDYNKKPLEMTFLKEPENVYVMGQNNIEIMLKLGLKDKIVMAYGMDGEISEDLKSDFEQIKYNQNKLPLEDVLALKPDFILGWYSVFTDKNLGEMSFWNDRNIKTYSSLNSGCRPSEEPRSVEYEIKDILNIGKIFNVEDKAKALVDEINKDIETIKNGLKNLKKTSIAILEEETEGSFRVYGKNTLGYDIGLKAGADFKVGQDELERKISTENLIEKNPDAIFMVYFNGYRSSSEVIDSIKNNKALQNLSAVKNNKIYAINLNNIYCSGLRTKAGILEISKKLYPELYK